MEPSVKFVLTIFQQGRPFSSLYFLGSSLNVSSNHCNHGKSIREVLEHFLNLGIDKIIR